MINLQVLDFLKITGNVILDFKICSYVSKVLTDSCSREKEKEGKIKEAGLVNKIMSDWVSTVSV